MSEVKRYWVPCGVLADQSGWHPDDNEVVLAGEHDVAIDAQRLRADTAEAELRTERLRANAAVGDANDAERKLAAAEQRIAELKSALENLIAIYSEPDDQICCNGHHCGCMGATKHQQAVYYAKEAINPNPNPDAVCRDHNYHLGECTKCGAISATE